MKKHTDVIEVDEERNTALTNKGVKALEKIYAGVCKGIPGESTAVELAKEYLSKNEDKETAVKKLINAQIAKCTAVGIVTGLGGLITLPITVPADITGTVYVQLRMVAAIAYIYGYKPSDDAVRTLAFMCLVGMSITDVVKGAGVKFGKKAAVNAIKKIPGTALTKINQDIGFRFITKFGEKGIVNLGKLAPAVGAAISGGVDFLTTKKVADEAMKKFAY
jgi:hypothetical protein